MNYYKVNYIIKKHGNVYHKVDCVTAPDLKDAKRRVRFLSDDSQDEGHGHWFHTEVHKIKQEPLSVGQNREVHRFDTMKGNEERVFHFSVEKSGLFEYGNRTAVCIDDGADYEECYDTRDYTGGLESFIVEWISVRNQERFTYQY